jgi:hypothetical protein
MGFLIFMDLIPKSPNLVAKVVSHFMMSSFPGSDSLEQSITNIAQCDGINIIPNGIEGCGDCAGQQQWAA